MSTKKRAKKRQHQYGDAPADRTYHYEFQVSERKVAKTGTPIKLKGRRGDYIFIRHTVLNDGREWIDTLAPQGGGWTTVTPDNVTRLAPVRRGRR
jgi:hypothetical protein